MRQPSKKDFLSAFQTIENKSESESVLPYIGSVRYLKAFGFSGVLANVQK